MNGKSVGDRARDIIRAGPGGIAIAGAVNDATIVDI